MSLAPLHFDLINDLHVSITSVLHHAFAWLQPAKEKLAIFRVPADVLHFKSLSHMIRIEHRCTHHAVRGTLTVVLIVSSARIDLPKRELALMPESEP